LNERRGPSEISNSADIDGLSLIGEGCTIKSGAQIVNSTIGPGCYIEEKARIENSVIWGHTRISVTAYLNRALVGRGCHIGRAAIVRPGSVLGDKTTLTDYTQT
jgi:NDP-sugar pyrophosphorylase family protein